jgi:hypothetical protein
MGFIDSLGRELNRIQEGRSQPFNGQQDKKKYTISSAIASNQTNKS